MAELPDEPDPKRRRVTVTISEPRHSMAQTVSRVFRQPIAQRSEHTFSPNNPNTHASPVRPLERITNGKHHAASTSTTTLTTIGNYAPFETFPKIPLFTRPPSAHQPDESLQPSHPDPASNPLHHLANLALSQPPPPLRPRSPLPTGLHSNSSHYLASYRPPDYQRPTHPAKYPTYFDLCRLRNATGPLGTDRSHAELLALRRDVVRAKADSAELERKAGVIAGRTKRNEWRTTMVDALAGVVRRRIDAMGEGRERGRWWVNADRKGEMSEEAEVRGDARFAWDVEEGLEPGMVDGSEGSTGKKLKTDERQGAGEPAVAPLAGERTGVAEMRMIEREP